MKIQVLMENTTHSQLLSEHGLCVYVETKRHRLLSDTGASGKFAGNAAEMGITLKDVDTVILSHGHYDHGGGLQTFLEQNQKAKIYLQKSAFGKYYSDHGKSIDYIGLDKELWNHPRHQVLEGNCQIDTQLFLFTDVPHAVLWPASNKTLYEKTDGQYVQDEFRHEQNLVITEGKRQVLLCGCAHNGIVNILKKSQELTGRWPDAVIGGFHLMNPSKKEEADERLVTETAGFLAALRGSSGPTKYYTGHCTGIPALELLKELLGERVEPLYSGKEIRI